MTTRSRVAVYARISQDRDQSGLGIMRQLQDCRAEVQRRGWTIAEEYVDDDLSASGYSAKVRPSCSKLLSDIQAGAVDAVVVWHLDRLHRKPIELEEFVATCSRANLTEVVTLHGDLDLGSGDGLLVARLLGAVAANESDAKSRRGRRKMQELAEAGLPHGGGRCFGFEEDQVTIREVEARIFREMAARCLAGETLMSMVRWLNTSEIPSPSGLNEWRTSTLRRLLQNPRIYGMRVHRGQIIGNAVWEPIIAVDDGERLRVLLTDPARRTSRSARRYLLSGMCRCSRCGATLVSKPRDTVRRYSCIGGLGHTGCGGLAIGAEATEELIVRSVLLRLDSSSLAAALQDSQHSEGLEKDLSQSIHADVVRLEELAILWSDSVITATEWRTARDRIDKRLNANRKTLIKLRGNGDLISLVGNGQVLSEQWASLNLTRQVAIIKTVVDHVVIRPAIKRGANQQVLERIEVIWRI